MTSFSLRGKTLSSSNQEIHPLPETLRAWMRDELDAHKQMLIEDHLTNCDACARALDDFQDDVDPLLQKIIASESALNPTFALSDHSRLTLSDTGTDGSENSPAKSKSNRKILGGRWELLRLMATGGSGEVWVARDITLGRNVVVKSLRDETAGNPSVRRRFLREAKVTARLNHPGTVFVLDLVEDGKDSYYVMSLIEGRTLTETIRDHHLKQIEAHANPHDMECLQGLSVSLNRLMTSLVSVTQVIAFAHLRGVLHRDLKSENIVMGDFGQVTVIDWGLAMNLMDPKPESDGPTDSSLQNSGGSNPFETVSDAYESHPLAPFESLSSRTADTVYEGDSDNDVTDSTEGSCAGSTKDSSTDPFSERLTIDADDRPFVTLSKSHTRAGARLGTPSFMSPEQARGDNSAIDQRTDVYGLGAIMYEMLTGSPPFVGDDVEQVLADVIEKQPVAPSDLVPTLPLELERICLRAISKNPDARQQSPTELATEIEAWLSFEGERQNTLEARRQLFESTTDLMLIHNYAPEAVWANSAWESLGWCPENLIGKTSTDLIHPDDIGPKDSIIGPMREGRSLSGLKLRMRDSVGVYHWYDWTFSPVPNEELVYAVGRNVNEYMQRTRREQEALLDVTPDAIIVLNRDRTIRYCNRSARSLFGYELDDIRNEPITKVMPEFDNRFPGEIDLDSGNQVEFKKQPINGLHQSGSQYPLSICLSGVQIGLSVLTACCIRKMGD